MTTYIAEHRPDWADPEDFDLYLEQRQDGDTHAHSFGEWSNSDEDDYDGYSCEECAVWLGSDYDWRIGNDIVCQQCYDRHRIGDCGHCGEPLFDTSDYVQVNGLAYCGDSYCIPEQEEDDE